MGPQVQGVSKKTSFSQNCPWQILLLIMRNPLSLFITNAGGSFCNSYIHYLVGSHIYYILYRTLVKWYYLSCSQRQVYIYFSKCPPPAAMHFTALAFMSIIALLTIAGSICATWKLGSKICQDTRVLKTRLIEKNTHHFFKDKFLKIVRRFQKCKS